MKNAVVVVIAVISMCAIVRPAGAQDVNAHVDPCALLALEEVRQALPGSNPGSIDRGLEKAGLLRCSWESADRRLLLIASRERKTRRKTKRGRECRPSWIRADAERRVRPDVVHGVGEEAVAAVDRRDPANGIIQDAALIVIRRGTWLVTLPAPQLARRKRAGALRVLTELGKGVVRRLN